MSAIHYKFSSSNEYKNVKFDGMTISLFDLKKAIMEKQKLKSTELDLHITNAQTLQVYKDESLLIPKNTAVLVRRIPLGPIRDSKVYVVKRNESAVSTQSMPAKTYQENDSAPKLSLDELKKTSNLAEANASEEDKIKAAIAQSTNEYDPSNFVKPPRYGSYKYNTSSTLSTGQIRCYRCNQQGHYSGQCPLPKGEALKQHHHATGIPRSHMIEVNKDSKGAMLTADGRYVVPWMDKKGYDIGKKERPPFVPVPVAAPTQDDDEEEPIPDELICLLCKDLLVDAVVIPCCGNSYCDECIRNALLESDSHQCPTCHKCNISPDSLIANKFLRQAVNKFRNDTGIAKKRSNAPVWPRPAPSESNKIKPAQPVKVTYGPPRTSSMPELVNTSSAYIVKASTDQVHVSKAYNLAKRTPETGGGSPRDPNQPIRIKLGKSDKAEVVSSNQSTPSDNKMQSTPADNSSLPSSTPSDSYTFNSTPESNEQKAKPINVAEPLPPGISPPTAKVVRPLMDESRVDEQSESLKLSGIQPLSESVNAVEDESNKESDVGLQSFTIPIDSPPEANQKAIEEIDQPLAPGEEHKELPCDAEITSPPAEDVLDSGPTSSPSQAPPDLAEHVDEAASNMVADPQNDDLQQSRAVEHEFEVSEISTSDADSSLASTVPQHYDASVVQLTSIHASLPQSIMTNIPPVNTSLPPPNVHSIPQAPPVAMPPPVHAQLIPGLLPGMPPIPPPVSAAGVNIFQHPPPPFPMFPPLGMRPGHFTQPPPNFPPHPSVLPPPSAVAAMAIPSLAKTSALPPPPGVETAPIPTLSRSSERHSRHDRYSPHKSERSPRKRTDRRNNKSKLDIMSDEFAEKLKKRPERRRRERSRSSYSSSSYSRSSSSYSSSSSSYSSSGSSWSSSSYSRSRSASPKKKRRDKRSKRQSSKRKRSRSWSDRSTSREKSRKSRRKEARKRREKSPKRKKRDERSYSPHSPRRKPGYSGREQRHSPHRSRRLSSPRRKHPENSPSHPVIPVIGRNQPAIPRLPSKEEADFERDQALYAHYRQAYERDWYERGIMPPAPYDRFIQARFSRSPSPPGTGHTLPTSQMGFAHFPPPPLQSLPGMIDPRAPMVPPLGLIPGQQVLPPSQAPPGWEDKRYPPNRGERYPPHRGDQPRRDFPGGSNGPPHPDFSSRPRHLPHDYDPKEEQYRMQLSPRSRRRFDADRQSRVGRSQYREGRYAGHQRRNYDDYQARRRAREQQRDASSPRGSHSRSKRSRQSPDPEEGDATPVRDERPPPEEKHLEKRTVTRKAGDVSKVGKKPRRNKKSDSVDRSKRRRSESPAKRDSTTSRSNKSESSSKTVKRKADSSRDGGSKTKSETSKSRKREKSETPEKRSRRDGTPSKSSKKDASTKASVIAKKSETKPSEGKPKETRTKGEKEKISEPSTDVMSNDRIQDEKELKRDAKTENLETKDENIVTQAAVASAEPALKDEKPLAVSSTVPKLNDTHPEEAATKSQPAKEATSKTAQAVGKDKIATAKTTTKEKKKDKPSKTIKPVRPKTTRSEDPKKDSSSRTTKAKKTEGSSKHEAEKASVKNEAVTRGKDKKLVEYDGTGPPPAGDELVKITIPKSKWEESDDEGKSNAAKKKEEAQPARRVVKTSEVKPSKGRRIRIKRKSPVVADAEKESVKEIQSVEAPTDIPKSVVQSAIKKIAPPAKEVISDARMVITLRRNSKHLEEQGRRVSLGTDEAHFEPEYDEVPISERNSKAEKGGRSRDVLRSASQDGKQRDDDPDALALSDYSGFSNDEAEKSVKHVVKKKKKKKKKHRNRSQTSDNSEEESQKKRSRSHDATQSDDHMSADEKKHRKRRKNSSAEERLKKKESKKKHRDESRDERRRSNDESVSREHRHKKNSQSKASRRDESHHDSHDRLRDGGKRSRDKKRKKEKRHKHRHRRESGSFTSDEVEAS